MDVKRFVNALGVSFFTGVPDSLLQPLCTYLTRTCGDDPTRHLIAPNEGNAMGLAAGYHLATGKIPLVYMQNSGLGNVVNPYTSLVSPQVYNIPMILVIGWRGEPGVKDEPQHIHQGALTCSMLAQLQIPYTVLSVDSAVSAFREAMDNLIPFLHRGQAVAVVVRKGALTDDAAVTPWQNRYTICREDAIGAILQAAGENLVVSTTGKISREVYEWRVKRGEPHTHDFLTVGSMGHSSAIAVGIALQQPSRRVWCLDGDGAVLMHMGAMGMIGQTAPPNLVHVMLNNAAHESVGGMPTVAGGMDWPAIVRGCGYPAASTVTSIEDLSAALAAANAASTLSFLEVQCAIGSRSDLGRPRETPADNKQRFMDCIRQDNGV